MTQEMVMKIFPPVHPVQEAEYAFLSRYFFKPSEGLLEQQQKLKSQDYILREIIHKRLDRGKDLISFSLVSHRVDGQSFNQNEYNKAGYRYFVGVVFDEINSELDKTRLGQTAYFFESAFPFISVLRDVVISIFGSFL